MGKVRPIEQRADDLGIRFDPPVGIADEAASAHDYLEQARQAVVERGAAYGHPLDNHEATAAFWRVYLHRRLGIPMEILNRLDGEDVCHMMDLQKTCREANERKSDNIVDKCGYMQNIGMIRERNTKGEA